VLSWRWCFYVNLVIAIPTTLVALRLLVNHSDPDRARIDIPGVLTWTLGLFALVFGFSNAETHGWGATATVVALVASPVLLTAFVLIERSVEHPLMPLHIVWDRARGGSYAALFVTGAGVFAVFLFLTYFLQVNLRFSPLKTGLAFVPLSVVLVITSTTVQTRLVQRTGVKPLVLVGMALAAIAMVLFAQLTPTSSYVSGVLPGLLITGVGMGCIFAPAFSAATLGVASNEAGIASAMVNTSQQIGGSVGTSLLSTIYASAVASYLASHAHVGDVLAAQVHGDSTAFWWAAGIFGLGFALALVILPSQCETRPASTFTALARYAIGNCSYEESADSAAVTAGRGSPEPALAP
jgi:MFS family permease